METVRENSDSRRRFARWFGRKAITYVVICSFLTFVNWYSSPNYWWVLWVIAGWGLRLVLNLAYYLTDCDDKRDYDEF